MTDYPRDLPINALYSLVERSQGEVTNPQDLAWACWQVLGYSLGKDRGAPPLEGPRNPKNLFAFALVNSVVPPAGDIPHLEPVPWREVFKETFLVLRGILE